MRKTRFGFLIVDLVPQKHGTTSKPLKPTRLDQEEQEKIAKTGAEMKMVTNEMDAETDKWNTADENNDIVKRAKNMSAMAMAMYQFTKGEGTLKTTQDLFTQAEYFAEEANRLYKVVRQFSYQVINGDSKRGRDTNPNCLCVGSSGTAEEGAVRARRQSSSAGADATVLGEGADCGQGGHLRQGGPRDSGDKEPYERH